MWEKQLKKLREQLAAKKLSEAAINAMVKAAEDALKAVTDEAAAVKAGASDAFAG